MRQSFEVAQKYYTPKINFCIVFFYFMISINGVQRTLHKHVANDIHRHQGGIEL